MKIAVLESEKEVAERIKKELEAAGEEVVGIYDDGEEGLRGIERTGADGAVISMVLKGKDGLSVLEGLQERGWKGRVIVTGSYADDAVIEEALKRGAKYYLMRPIGEGVIAKRMKGEQESDTRRDKQEGREERRNKLTLEERISTIFISIGIPPHIKGYGYLREGIKMAVEEPKILNRVTKELYPRIAEKYNSTASKVERAIRHSIEVAWNRQKIEAINAVFGVRVYLGTEKPTNSEFIALVADKLLLEEMAK